MPGSTYRPLEIKSGGDEPSQYERFREEAQEGTPFEELVCLTLLDTGLRVSAMAHLVEDWLDWRDDTLYLDVPAYQKCTLGTNNQGTGGDTTETGEPCCFCKDRSLDDRDFLPADHKLPDGGDCWAPKSEAGYKGRLIPVKEDETQQILMTYFRVYDTVSGQSGVRNAVTRVAKRIGIYEPPEHQDDIGWPTPHSLRDTYGTRLAMKGFTRDEIMRPMGHASIHQADDYIKLSGVEAANAFDEKW